MPLIFTRVRHCDADPGVVLGDHSLPDQPDVPVIIVCFAFAATMERLDGNGLSRDPERAQRHRHADQDPGEPGFGSGPPTLPAGHRGRNQG